MNGTPALHNMNPQGRFSSRAKDYAKYRPSYPTETIDYIVAELANKSQLVAADIGAGTGISARLLADRGFPVIAIEPNESMRSVAQAHPLVAFRHGSAEDTKLPDNSVDLVTCFQAFHWFNPEPTLKEFARILKPQGNLAVVWNNRHRNDEFTNEYGRLTQIVSNNNSELRYGTERYLNHPHGFNPVRHLIFPYQQALNFQALVGRAMSTSYIPQTGEAHTQFIQDLHQLHQKYCDDKGLVYLQYQTSLYFTMVERKAPSL
jgi:ubiquinone/menaquinone biosynthesis C-methylase UbiE